MIWRSLLPKKKQTSQPIDELTDNNNNDSLNLNTTLDDQSPDNSEINVNKTEKKDNDEIILNLENEILDLKDQLMRSLAEGENLRKRTIKEIEHSKKYSHVSFVKDLIYSVDNLQRALEAIPKDKSSLSDPIKNLIIGLEIVEKELESTLEKHNVKPIFPLGKKFDYNYHQAMFEVATNEKEPGIVVEVSQKGYLLHDRLVRPAMVGISKKVSEKNENDS